MSIKFNDYKFGFKIVSLAKNEKTKEELMKENLAFIFVNDEKILLFPENVILSEKQGDVEKIKSFNNFDVFELWNNGILICRYSDLSNDNYFFITSGCNSNCIMCPSPEFSRKNAKATNLEDLFLLAKHIPSDVPHLTITGGEPFLIGKSIFPFISYLKEKFTDTEFLFLTNGRVFSIDDYTTKFKESIPQNSIVAIPLHGSNSEVHDLITQSKGSFKQTTAGIKHLLKNDIKVEIRLVVNKLNIEDFDNISQLIIKQFRNIEYVSVIAMEMTGNALKNKDKVWVSYKESFTLIANSIKKLVENGIDVKLYNFPICTVESPFWTLCKKSISTEKVRFADECVQCKYKKSCSGIFAGTFKLEKEDIKPIL